MESDSLIIEHEAIFYALSINAIPQSFVSAAKERLNRLEIIMSICGENEQKKIPKDYRKPVLLNLETGIFYRTFQEAAESLGLPNTDSMRHIVYRKKSPVWLNLSTL